MKTRGRWSSWWFASVIATAPTIAHAQDVSPAEHEAAVTNFQAGRRFVEQNNCKDAISRFIESLKHEQNVGARFNLAECWRKEGREADAWNQYKSAEQLAIQKKDERAADARGPLAELEPKVTKLRLALPQAADTTVRIDGKAVEPADFGLLATGYALTPNDPHTIEVSAPNRRSWTKTSVKGPAGAELPAMTVELGPAPAPPDREAGTGQRLTGILVGGAGVAGVAVGVVFGFVALGKRSDYNSAVQNLCPDRNACDPANRGQVQDARDAIGSPATVSTIAFVAGGALITTGAILYFTAPKTASSSAARVHLSPAIGPGAGGAALRGTF
jgi:hypothetical protein